jgi:hypothetical protein
MRTALVAVENRRVAWEGPLISRRSILIERVHG